MAVKDNNLGILYIDPTPELDERSALQKMRGMDLTTDSMKMRNALKAKTIAAAAKVDWQPYDLISQNIHIQPDNFGQPMTDVGMYEC